MCGLDGSLVGFWHVAIFEICANRTTPTAWAKGILMVRVCLRPSATAHHRTRMKNAKMKPNPSGRSRAEVLTTPAREPQNPNGQASKQRTLLLSATRADNAQPFSLAANRITERRWRYRDLIDSIDEGFCIIELIFDQSEKPIDYRILEANPAFAKQTGLNDATGKRMRELVPNHEAHWFEMYGQVAVTSTPVRFVHQAKALGERWFDVYAFPLGGREGRKVGSLFSDITDRKKTEEALRQSYAELSSYAEEVTRFNRVAVGRELRMIELKKEINDLCLQNGQPPRYSLDFEGAGRDFHD
jgi:PAS domain S-box-containing protein